MCDQVCSSFSCLVHFCFESFFILFVSCRHCVVLHNCCCCTVYSERIVCWFHLHKMCILYEPSNHSSYLSFPFNSHTCTTQSSQVGTLHKCTIHFLHIHIRLSFSMWSQIVQTINIHVPLWHLYAHFQHTHETIVHYFMNSSEFWFSVN